MNLLHVVINALLIGAVYYALEHFGVLEGRTKFQRFLILLLPIAIVVFIVNLIIPHGT